MKKKIYKCNNITNNILNFLYKHNKTNEFVKNQVTNSNRDNP